MGRPSLHNVQQIYNLLQIVLLWGGLGFLLLEFVFLINKQLLIICVGSCNGAKRLHTLLLFNLEWMSVNALWYPVILICLYAIAGRRVSYSFLFLFMRPYLHLSFFIKSF